MHYKIDGQGVFPLFCARWQGDRKTNDNLKGTEHMFNIANVKPGQRVTVQYSADIDWGRTTGNPFVDLDVQRTMTVAFTAAGVETYDNMLARSGKQSTGKGSWHTPALDVGPCVRRHKGNGNLYLAGVNHDTIECQFSIGGQPASPAEVEQIRGFLKVSPERVRGEDFRVWTVDKLTNAVAE